MNRRTGPRILTKVAWLTMVVSAICFVPVFALNAFVFDEYDAYGEVPIPGSSNLHLPAGDVTVSFHTVLIGGSGSGLPVPPLKYRFQAPEGVAEPQLTEDYGTTTTVNNDARVRIGYLHVPTEGSYDIVLDGNVSAYLNPSLAFGHGSSYGSVPWILAAIFAFGLMDLVIARIWAARVRRSESSSPPAWNPGNPGNIPSGEGVRIEQLNSLARLRDSGALTEAEYKEEKKRLFDGL